MSTEDFPYLHGFSSQEQERLRQQAAFAEHTLFHDIDFSGVENLLEVGCGVGAQSEIILRRFPNVKLTGIDQNEKQLEAAKKHLDSLTWAKNRYDIQKMDASNMDYKSNSFDAAYICWVLEHVTAPEQVLGEVRRVLRPGSWIHIHEVMNHTFFLDPYSPNVWKYWMAFNDYQYENAGDPFVGAKLGNLLVGQGFREIQTKVKTWHFDNRNPEKRRETIEFWTNLMMSAAEQLIQEKVIDRELAEAARKELKSVIKNPNAVFFYSFMEARAMVL